MNIEIKTIPNNEQRYPTCGDYFMDENEKLQFRISQMGNKDYEFLVSIHEQIEQHMLEKRGVSIAEIDAFDIAFEKLREENPTIIGDQEPGYMISAPYHKEHCFAEKIERQLAEELGVNWDDYEKTINAL